MKSISAAWDAATSTTVNRDAKNPRSADTVDAQVTSLPPARMQKRRHQKTRTVQLAPEKESWTEMRENIKLSRKTAHYTKQRRRRRQTRKDKGEKQKQLKAPPRPSVNSTQQPPNPQLGRGHRTGTFSEKRGLRAQGKTSLRHPQDYPCHKVRHQHGFQK